MRKCEIAKATIFKKRNNQLLIKNRNKGKTIQKKLKDEYIKTILIGQKSNNQLEKFMKNSIYDKFFFRKKEKEIKAEKFFQFILQLDNYLKEYFCKIKK